ncbi:MAG: hypothetical protein H0V76_10730 [Blastocatellia bacterium]|nr:hypothetical protein [Blastocatellia bacterium]
MQNNSWYTTWGVPYGQIRSREVRARNAERRSRRDLNRYDNWAYSPTYSSNWNGRVGDRYDRYDRFNTGWNTSRSTVYNVSNTYRIFNTYGSDRYRNYDRGYQYGSYDPYYSGGGNLPYYSGANYGAYDPYYQDAYYGDDDYYGDDYYGDDYYYGGRTSWKETLLRTIIGGILGDRVGSDRYYAVSNYDPYDSYGSPYRAAHTSNNYGASPMYSSYGSTGYYDPYGSYEGYYEDPYYHQDPYYNNDPYYLNISSSIPVAGVLGQSYGGGHFENMIASAAAQGYNEGYLAGLAAAESGYDNIAYHDPYSYQQSVYDPYSSSVGDYRRCLSEGRQLGYQDALHGDYDYDPMQDGNVDLVTVLLSNVMSMI